MEETDTYTYQANPDVSCRVEGDEDVILYNPDIDDFVLINSSALVIWEYLDKPRSVEEICAYLMESYEEMPEHDAVFQDVRTFLDDLEEAYICKEQGI